MDELAITMARYDKIWCDHHGAEEVPRHGVETGRSSRVLPACARNRTQQMCKKEKDGVLLCVRACV